MLKTCRKIIIYVFYSIAPFSFPFHALACEPLQDEYLDWKKRPQQMITYMKEKHLSRTHSFDSPFQENSDPINHIYCQTTPLSVIKSILLEAPKAQKMFFFLNLEVEDFETNWTRDIFTSLKREIDLPTDVIVYFISTCGHVCPSKKNHKEGIFNLYEFDHFPAEYVRDALYKQSLFLENEIDAVFTNKCLYKFCDPVGICLQIYNLLRPKTGLFFGDEFYFNIEGNSSKDGNEIFSYHMSLFRDIGAPFLLKRSFPDASQLNFVMRRKDEEPCHIPMRYHDLERISPNPNLTSGAVTVFRYTLNWNSHPLSDDTLTRTFYHGLERKYWIFGNKELYSWFQDRNLFLQYQGRLLKFWNPNDQV